VNCLRCGNFLKRGYSWDSIWQWRCSDCGFKWDSESLARGGRLQYLDDSGECTISKFAPFGCLAVFMNKEV
jgi:transposase-like protein